MTSPIPEPVRRVGAPLVAYGVAAVAAAAWVVAYSLDVRHQWMGLALAVALTALGVALVTTAHRLLARGPFEEPRPAFGDAEDRDAVVDALDRAVEVPRRRLLVTAAGAAGTAMVAAVLVPLRALGPRPGPALGAAPWRSGTRLVDDRGSPITAASIEQGALVTAFPDGHPDDPNGPVVLVRVDPATLRLPAERAGWTPGGLVAYSKICTHLECPVGLYQPVDQTLLCPCHQSLFDVLDGARPVSGPADRALPQLPLLVDADGVVRAAGPMSGPVGVKSWSGW